MRKNVRAVPWIDKLCVNMQRAQKHPERHERLKMRLSLNRGIALGLPKRYPSAWLESRVRDRWQAKVHRTVARGECPF